MTVSVSTTIYLINYFSKSDFGSIRLIGSISLVMSYLSSFGLESIVQRYVLEYIENESYQTAKKIFNIAFLIRISGVLTIVLIMYLFKANIINLLNMPNSIEIHYELILAFISISPLEGLIGSIIGMYLENYKLKIIVLVKNIIKLCLILFMVKYDYGFSAFVYTLFGISIFSLVTTSIIAFRKYILWEDGDDKSTIAFNEIIKYGTYNYFGMNAGIFKQLTMDNFFIAAFMGTTGVADYGFASQLVSYPRMLNPLNLLRSTYNSFLLKSYIKKG